LDLQQRPSWFFCGDSDGRRLVELARWRRGGWATGAVSDIFRRCLSIIYLFNSKTKAGLNSQREPRPRLKNRHPAGTRVLVSTLRQPAHFLVPSSHESDPIPFRLLIQLHPAVIIPSNVDPDHVHNNTCFFLNERVMSNPDSEYSSMPDHQVSVSAPTGSRRLREHASELCTNLRRLSQWILVNTVHLQYSHQIRHQYCWYCSATARSSRTPRSEHVFRSSPPPSRAPCHVDASTVRSEYDAFTLPRTISSFDLIDVAQSNYAHGFEQSSRSEQDRGKCARHLSEHVNQSSAMVALGERSLCR
jgi:hypothetical protein